MTILICGDIALASIAPADSVQHRLILKGGDDFMIPELGAIVTRDGTDLKVFSVLPAETRPEIYRSIDLRADDLVLMVSGKRVKTIPELQKAHARIPIGAEIKLGIQRGEALMLVSFPKASPEDLPRMQRKIVTIGGDEGTEALPAVGVILVEKGHSVIIDKLIESEHAAVKGLDVKEGDAILSMNGKRYTSPKLFVEAYDGITVGDEIAWSTLRKGKSISIKFPKPKPAGRVIIRRNDQ